MSIPSYTALRTVARVGRCREEIRSLEKDIAAYQADNLGALPGSLADMGQGSLLDPWGNPYQYRPANSATGAPYRGYFGHLLNSDYDLYSLGDGGIPSTLLITDSTNKNNVVRANDGAYDGLASEY